MLQVMGLAFTFRFREWRRRSDGALVFCTARRSCRSVAMATPSGVKVWSSRHADSVTAEQCGERGFPMAMTGTVKFFNGERGYGFIKPDDGWGNLFVLISARGQAG